MIPTNIDRVIEISAEIKDRATILQRFPQIKWVFARSDNDDIFRQFVATSPAAQAFIEAFKAEQEAEIERLKTELKEL